MRVPVGIFDDYFDVGIHRFGRPDDEFLCCPGQLVQPELGPASLPLFTYTPFALAVRKEEIVQDQLVEKSGRIFYDLPDLFPVFRIRIAVGLEPVPFANRQGDATRNLNVPRFKKPDGVFKRLLFGDNRVPVRLEIDLVHLYLPGYLPPAFLQPFGVRHAVHFVDTGVDRGLEVFVIAFSKNKKREGKRAEK